MRGGVTYLLVLTLRLQGAQHKSTPATSFQERSIIDTLKSVLDFVENGGLGHYETCDLNRKNTHDRDFILSV